MNICKKNSGENTYKQSCAVHYQSINQSISQSVSQLVSQSINRSLLTRATLNSTNELVALYKHCYNLKKNPIYHNL